MEMGRQNKRRQTEAQAAAEGPPPYPMERNGAGFRHQPHMTAAGQRANGKPRIRLLAGSTGQQMPDWIIVIQSRIAVVVGWTGFHTG